MSEAGSSGRVAVGHPVDVASGEFFTTGIDADFPGGVPLRVERWFGTALLTPAALVPAAALDHDAPFGPGWRASWQIELRRTLDGFALRDATGSERRLADAAGGQAFAFTGRLLAPGSAIELSRIDPLRVRVVHYGIDRDPTSHVFVAAEAGAALRLEAIERTAAARVEIVRDAAGRPLALTQTRQRRSLRLEWIGERVARVTAHSPDGSSRLVRAYAYDELGRLTAAEDARGPVTTYAYDAAGRMIEERMRGGSVYAMRYDARGRCTYVSGARGYQERTLRFDDEARITLVSDSHGASTKYERNERGQILKETSPLGAVTAREFDDLGRPLRSVRPSGALTEWEYDAEGRTVRVTRADGGRRLFEHDAWHRLVAMTDEAGYRTEYAHDADHNVVAKRVPDTAPWHLGWTPAAEPLWERNPLGAERRAAYDEHGNQVQATDWRGAAFTTTYDTWGRAVHKADPLGHVTSYAWDDDDTLVGWRTSDGRTWSRETWPGSDVVVYRRPDGRTITVRASECGQPLEVADEDGYVTRFEWDSEPGRLLAVVNARGERHDFAYDADGQRVRSRSFDGREFQHSWAAGLLRSSVDPRGSTIAYEYDALERITRRIDPDGETALEYDALGNLTSAIAPGAVVSFAYDVHGSVIHEDQAGVVVRRAYDALGRRVVLGSPLLGETACARDANGACIQISRGALHVDIARDALGREVRRVLPGAGAYDHAYDASGRIVAQTFRTEASQLAESTVRRALTHDAVTLLASDDSLRGRTELLHDGRENLVGVVRPGGLSDFHAYDANGSRIWAAHTRSGAEVLSAARTAGFAGLYDLAAQGAERVQTASMAPGDRLLRFDAVDRRIAYAYDAAGCVVEKTVQRGESTERLRLAWNTKRQLVAATKDDGRVWRYQYDALGRRIAKVGPTGSVVRYVWDEHELIGVIDDGVPTARVVFESALLLIDDGLVHHVLSDQAGSPSEVLTADGRLEHVVMKGTWGEAFAGGPVDQPFAGQIWDAETGLHHNVFRYYDPDTGRYLSPDPIELWGGDNAFAWVPDPFMWVDLHGLACRCGCQGERMARKWLEKKGYKVIGSVQNRSGHGIDLVGRDANGELHFFEVKTSEGTTAPGLSVAQQQGAAWFVESRLGRAAKADGAWGATHDPNTSANAAAMLGELRNSGQPPKGSVISITQGDRDIQETPW
jgi:RHS repeat-associated protein